MSEDLISRRAVKSSIKTIRECWSTSPFVSADDMKLYSKVFNVVLQEISDCQTAFDKKKVMEKLHEAADLSVEDGLWHVELQKAFEIVEKGGIE